MLPLELLCFFGSSGVVELAVICAYYPVIYRHVNVETFVKAFGNIPNIRTLYVRNRPLPGSQHAIGDGSAKIDDSIALAFPSLQELKLEYASLRTNDTDTLIAYLNRRRESGLGIQKIVFVRNVEDDKIREVSMSRLREIVPTVIWEPRQNDDLSGK